MKKFLIIVLMLFISVFGIYSNSIGDSIENGFYTKINYELNNLELYLKNNDEIAMVNTLERICDYVYDYARYLIENNLYNKEILEIITLVNQAVKQKDISYIEQARQTLNNFFIEKEVVDKSNHS